jgi:hypothetical protein
MESSGERNFHSNLIKELHSCRTGFLFGSRPSLEMVRAEVPALSRAVPQDGNELNSMENLKR